MKTSSSNPVRSESQLGLIDLFKFTTLFSVIFGCHSLVGQSAGVVLCGGLTVYLVLRLLPCHYGVLGGMLAFASSVVCMPVMFRFGSFSVFDGILLCFMFPTAAYVLGAIYTEFREL